MISLSFDTAYDSNAHFSMDGSWFSLRTLALSFAWNFCSGQTMLRLNDIVPHIGHSLNINFFEATDCVILLSAFNNIFK